MTEPNAPEVQAAIVLCGRISEYVRVGGLWNPESMNHDKVHELLLDCRDVLADHAALVGRLAETEQSLRDWESTSIGIEAYVEALHVSKKECDSLRAQLAINPACPRGIHRVCDISEEHLPVCETMVGCWSLHDCRACAELDAEARQMIERVIKLEPCERGYEDGCKRHAVMPCITCEFAERARALTPAVNSPRREAKQEGQWSQKK